MAWHVILHVLLWLLLLANNSDSIKWGTTVLVNHKYINALGIILIHKTQGI